MAFGNNMKQSILSLLGCVLLLMGCNTLNEVYPGTKTAEYVVEFVNSSNHTLYVGIYAERAYTFQNWGDKRIETGKITLSPLCRHFIALQKFGIWEDADYPPFKDVLCSAPVVYIDGNIKMKFNAIINTPYNIGMSENFTKVTEDGKTFYRYEFTDSDYEYAVANGEMGDFSQILDDWNTTE